MTKLKHCFIAYRHFDSILNEQPMMSGCYQWIRVFNSDVVNYWGVIDDPEKWDVIQFNMDSMDMNMLFEIRKRIGWESSTKLVANMDYAPGIWKDSYPHPLHVKHAFLQADRIFATNPEGKDWIERLTGRKVALITHPCETHVLKRLGTTFESNHVAIIYHRYDNPVMAPYLALHDINYVLSMVGYMERKDSRASYTRTMYDNIIPYMKFFDFVKLLAEARVAYEPFTVNSPGRATIDTGCVRTPTVGSNRVYSMRVVWPETSVDPMDVKKIRELTLALIHDESFRQDVIEQAYYNVEFFGHKASREKYMQMLEDDSYNPELIKEYVA